MPMKRRCHTGLDAAEDLVEVTAYDTAMRRFASGEEEAVPAEFAKRLIACERPVRVWRDIRGLSGKALAEKAGRHWMGLN